MTSDATVVARYHGAKRAAVEQTLRKIMRMQGVSMLILAVVVALIVLAPFIAVATDPRGFDATALGWATIAIRRTRPLWPVAAGCRECSSSAA